MTSLLLFLSGLSISVLFVWCVLDRNSVHLPPGPKGRPLLGLFGQIPQRKPWIFFQQLSKTYGNACGIQMSRRVLIKFTGDVFCIRVLGHVIILINSFEAADTLLNKRSIRYSSKPRRRMGEL